MEHWISWFHEQTDGDEVRAVSQAAESLGFTGVALSDHVAIPRHHATLHPELGKPYDYHLPMIDPFTVIASMGAATKKLRFMTYALVGSMRDPFSIARQAGSLAGLTNNRFALGITPGWLKEEISLLGHDPTTRGKRLDESLQIIRGLWNNELFSYDGEYYQFQEVALCPRPAVTPKILIGGNSAKSYERASQYDGWIGMTLQLEKVAEVSRIVRSSPGQKSIYIIPSQPLDKAYLQQLENAGVDGLVHMIWFPGLNTPVEEKCELMESFAREWIT